jgi:C4-dicarboxylate-specific signal transduction histidine kinase
MGYWLCDVMLSAYLNTGRYDLGWYAGRIYGALAASFVLAVLVLENSRLYRRLAVAAGRLKEGTTELMRANETLHGEIADRKRAEEGLRQAQTELAHVSRVTAMGELTASLAHEVNQPIGAFVANAERCLIWLSREVPSIEEARTAASMVVKDGMRAGEIITRIRQLFKKGTPLRESIDINDVISEMIVLLHGEATRYAVTIRTEPAGDLPQIDGDRVQLQQVIMNLIINGIEAMKDVDGTRELAIKSQRAENGQIMVSVIDTGVGLPPVPEDMIFTGFFTTKRHGTGMGLSISRSIVEAHGGRLWAVNNSTRGATFHLTLPAEPKAHS